MTHQLEKQEFDKVCALSRSLEAFQPMCTAVLEGIWPGEVRVDDPSGPRSAFLVTFLAGAGAASCFLAGATDNPGFNNALHKAIFEDRVAGEDVGNFLFTCSPEDWGGQLTVVAAPRQPAPMFRQHYVCRELEFDLRANLPEGYSILPMEGDLLERDDLEVPLPVKSTLGKWLSIREERFRDYGFVAAHEDRVVAWATVDFVTRGSGDLGFETG